MKAWGTHQNLFKDGQAHPVTDPASVEAALGHPEVPLRRAVGSTGPFELEPKELPKVPDPPARKSDTSAGPDLKKKRSIPRPPADRTKLDAAESALKTLDDARKVEEAELRKRRDELNTDISDAQSAYVAGRKSATAKIVDARKSYRDEGGGD